MLYYCYKHKANLAYCHGGQRPLDGMSTRKCVIHFYSNYLKSSCINGNCSFNLHLAATILPVYVQFTSPSRAFYSQNDFRTCHTNSPCPPPNKFQNLFTDNEACIYCTIIWKSSTLLTFLSLQEHQFGPLSLPQRRLNYYNLNLEQEVVHSTPFLCSKQRQDLTKNC